LEAATTTGPLAYLTISIMWVFQITDLTMSPSLGTDWAAKYVANGKSSVLVQCAMLKAYDACSDMGQL